MYAIIPQSHITESESEPIPNGVWFAFVFQSGNKLGCSALVHTHFLKFGNDSESCPNIWCDMKLSEPSRTGESLGFESICLRDVFGITSELFGFHLEFI